MLEIHKQYVFDENGNVSAVQIPIDEFKQIEKMLKSEENNSQANRFDASDSQKDCELKEVDGLLVVKSQGVMIPASIVEDMRDERIREVGGW